MQENATICLNGEYLPAAQGLIHVSDRGFRFGDGVFETIRLENGVPYQWAFHTERLNQGLSALRIVLPAIDLQSHARTLIEKNDARIGFLRISVSRGIGSKGYLPTGGAPTWVMEILEPTALPSQPFKLWLSSTPRIPNACLPVNHKLAHGIANTLALLEARDHACDEALQLTTDGALCEAAGANLFWITKDTLYTPALATGCLNGSTRAAILRLWPYETKEVIADLSHLAKADAVLLTNCRLGMMPVVTLAPNGLTFNAADPHLVTLQALLADDRRRAAWEHE